MTPSPAAQIDLDALELARKAGAVIESGWEWADGTPAGIVACMDATMLAELIRLARKGAVPQGWVLVPLEPTDKMLHEMVCEWDSIGGRNVMDNYAAMLAAAPKPDAGQPEQQGGE